MLAEQVRLTLPQYVLPFSLVAVDDPSKSPPTLREIARATGLALSTVSSALREQPGVAPETVKRVRETAEAMGWRPNPLVSAWLSHVRASQEPARQAALAFVISAPEGREAYLQSPIYADYLEGARARARALGFGFETFLYEEVGGSERLNGILEARGIPAAVIAPLSDRSEGVTLDWSRLTASTIAYSLESPAIHRAGSHHFHVADLAVRKLAELGYRRIGLAIPPELDRRATGMFTGGYWSGLHHLGLPASPPFEDFGKEVSFRRFGDWLKKHRPDAVLGFPLIAPWIEELSETLRLLEAPAFASLDRHPSHEGHAGVDQQALRIGATAVDLVTAQLFRNERGIPENPKLSLVEGFWRDGPSAPELDDF